MRNDFEKAMHFRHACKVFDETKKIPSDDLNFILEAGRMSPSSFGLEQWKFLVIRNPELKAKIRAQSWNQEQITSCSDLVVLLAKKNMRSTNSYVQKQFKRWGLPQEQFNGLINIYKGFVDTRSDDVLECWASKQCYIASGNMMTAAAYIGIDSCPIEGFDKAKVEETLQLDTQTYGVSHIVALGYRANEQRTRHRLAFDEVVEFIK